MQIPDDEAKKAEEAKRAAAEKKREREEKFEKLRHLEFALRAERGEKTERGGSLGLTPDQTAADIFEMAAGLGGHLVVAFVAPISAASRSPRRASAVDSAADVLAAAARAAFERVLEKSSQRTISSSTVD